MLEANHIYLGNCLDVMADIADGSVDAVVCDLPYGVLNRKNKAAQWDCMIPLEPLWAHYERIIKPRGAILLFAQGMFTARLMMSNPKMWRYNLVWDKVRGAGFLNAKRMPMRTHEDICVFYKQLPAYHPQMKAGEPNHSRGSLKKGVTNNCYGSLRITETGTSRMKYPGSILSFPKERGKKGSLHPTQKPVNLLRYLIRTYSEQGGANSRQCDGQRQYMCGCYDGGKAVYRDREGGEVVCDGRGEDQGSGEAAGVVCLRRYNRRAKDEARDRT